MTETAARAAQRLIDQSLAERKAVHAQWTPELAEELSRRSMDRYEHGGLVTFWGSPKSAPWRVVLEAKPETASEPAKLPPLAEATWDRSLPLLSCQWLGAASGNRWYQFRTRDRTSEAVHKARKTVLRRCADDVRIYETAIMDKSAELARLRAQVAEDGRDPLGHEKRLVDRISKRWVDYGWSRPTRARLSEFAADLIAEQDAELARLRAENAELREKVQSQDEALSALSRMIVPEHLQ